MTYTYIINVVAPIHNSSDKLVSYNKYPIVCISKKTLDEVFLNKQVQSSIDSTLESVGTELFDRGSIHIRVVDSKARITDFEKPLNKIISLWR
jgi:hypothetical protein